MICFLNIIHAALDHIWAEKDAFYVCHALLHKSVPTWEFCKSTGLWIITDRKKTCKTETVSLIHLQKIRLEQLLAQCWLNSFVLIMVRKNHSTSKRSLYVFKKHQELRIFLTAFSLFLFYYFTPPSFDI